MWRLWYGVGRVTGRPGTPLFFFTEELPNALGIEDVVGKPLFHNPTPGTAMVPVGENIIEYHYERRDEIASGIEEFVVDKARMKILFQAGYTYARRNPGKLAAKALTRGIPYVGWALLAYDAIQLYQWYQD